MVPVEYQSIKNKSFKLIAYIFPIGIVAILSPILLLIIKLFDPAGLAKHIFNRLLFFNFTGFWYGGIPYLLFLGIAFFIRSRLKHSGFRYSHLYSPMLFSFIFFLFWIFIFGITNYPDQTFNTYLNTFLLPVSLYIAIGGYVYLSLVGLLLHRFMNPNNE